MNWEAIGAVGEVLGAFGVILTLGYLAAQIRQNTGMMRAQTRAEISRDSINTIRETLVDDRLPGILVKRVERHKLDAEEQIRLDAYLRITLRQWESAHYQVRSKLYDEAEFSGQLQTWRLLLNNHRSGLREFWEAHRQEFSPEFVSEIDGLIGSRGASSTAAGSGEEGSG